MKSGEVIAEVETDKATMDLEAFDSGILRKVLVSEGTKVPVQSRIGIIGTKDEKIDESGGRKGGRVWRLGIYYVAAACLCFAAFRLFPCGAYSIEIHVLRVSLEDRYQNRADSRPIHLVSSSAHKAAPPRAPSHPQSTP